MPRFSHGGVWLCLTVSVVVTTGGAPGPDDVGSGHRASTALGWPRARDAAAAEAAQAPRPRAPPDALAAAVTALGQARNEKVRVQAALVLGRLGDPRGIPALARALADRSPVVRGVAAQVLGVLGAESARAALEVASRDESAYVRRHAAEALRRLTRATTLHHVLEINPMGDRTRRAPAALRERMRRAVVAELSPLTSRPLPGSFTVDGAIRALDVKEGKMEVEVRCGVQLILSTHPGQAIVLMSSGEATVERPRGRFRSGMLLDMQNEALQHAVRAAAEELRGHLMAEASTGTRTTTPAAATPSPPKSQSRSQQKKEDGD